MSLVVTPGMRASPGALLIVLAIFAFPVCTLAVEPARPAQESFLIRAAVAGNRLWLLSDAGRLSSVALDSHRSREERYPQPILDLCTSMGMLFAITQRPGDAAWTLIHLNGDAWNVVAEIPTKGENLVGLDCAPGDNV